MSDMTTKTVFTTGEAAKICKVSQQTIIRCFDSGQLKGFRVPGSRFRRIPREQLVNFMRDNGIPTDGLESGKRKVLVVDDEPELVGQDKNDMVNVENNIQDSFQEAFGWFLVVNKIADNDITKHDQIFKKNIDPKVIQDQMNEDEAFRMVEVLNQHPKSNT